jgi:hypothetical protein
MTGRHLAVPAYRSVVATAPTHGATTNAQGTNPSDAGVSVPAGTGGLFVLWCIAFNPTAASSGAVTPPATGSWSLRSYVASGISGTGIAAWVFTKAAAAETTPVAFTSTAGGNFHACALSRITHTGGTPVYNAAGTPNAYHQTNCQIPAVTTTTDACLLLALTCSNFGNWTAATGFTSTSSWLSGGCIVWRQTVTTPTTYGPSSVTLSSVDYGTTHCIAIGPP